MVANRSSRSFDQNNCHTMSFYGLLEVTFSRKISTTTISLWWHDLIDFESKTDEDHQICQERLRRECICAWNDYELLATDPLVCHWKKNQIEVRRGWRGEGGRNRSVAKMHLKVLNSFSFFPSISQFIEVAWLGFTWLSWPIKIVFPFPFQAKLHGAPEYWVEVDTLNIFE